MFVNRQRNQGRGLYIFIGPCLIGLGFFAFLLHSAISDVYMEVGALASADLTVPERGLATASESQLTCSKRNLEALIGSPHYFMEATKDNSTLLEMLALAKVEYALKNPFAEKFPPLIERCEAETRVESGGIYHNLFLKQYYLDHLLPLEVPEEVMHILLGRQHKALIVDIGANVGQFALPLARKGHTLYSFEPVDATCETLKHNVEVAGLQDRVHVTCVGLDDVESVQVFGYIGEKDPGSPGHSLIDPGQPNAHVSARVNTGPLHKFLPQNILKRVHLFKTDTQGNELAVLRGARELLKGMNRPRFVLVELSHGLLKRSRTDPMDILDIIYETGYICTHLAYHHLLRRGNENARLLYGVVDTPLPMNTGSVSAKFEDLLQSIDVHGGWTKNGTSLDPSVDNWPAWTDILCVG